MCTIGYCTHSSECAILNINYLKGAKRVEIYENEFNNEMTRLSSLRKDFVSAKATRNFEASLRHYIIYFSTFFSFSFLDTLIFLKNNAYQHCVGPDFILRLYI